MTITRKPINRGGIKSAGYDRNNRILEVEFSGGKIVQHTHVGEELATRFMASSSPFGFYQDKIEEDCPLKRY